MLRDEFALIFATLGACVMLLAYAVAKGRRVRNKEVDALAVHKIMVGIFVSVLVVSVVNIELFVRRHGGLWDTSWLFWLHMIFVTAGTTLLVLLLTKFRGTKRPDKHGLLAYSFVAVFLAMGVTGGLLFMNFPGFPG